MECRPHSRRELTPSICHKSTCAMKEIGEFVLVFWARLQWSPRNATNPALILWSWLRQEAKPILSDCAPIAVSHSQSRTTPHTFLSYFSLLPHSSGSSTASLPCIDEGSDVIDPRNSIACLVRSSSDASSSSSGRLMRYSAAITLLDSPSRA